MSLKTAITLVAALPATAFAATPAPVPEVLTGGPWNLHYANDSCQLAREFGAGDAAVLLQFQWFKPGDVFQLVLAGKRFANRQGSEVQIAFPTAGPPQKLWAAAGTLTDGQPALVIQSARLLPSPDPTITEDPATWSAEEPPVGVEVEHQVNRLGLDEDGKASLEFRLGSMGSPLQAVRACLDELVTHWGIDAQGQKTLSAKPIPLNFPGSWITTGDYPHFALLQSQQGIVNFRLIVGPDGSPQSCTIQSATNPPSFAKVVCDKLMKRARFKPALDKDGNPIASYFASSVRFVIG